MQMQLSYREHSTCTSIDKGARLAVAVAVALLLVAASPLFADETTDEAGTDVATGDALDQAMHAQPSDDAPESRPEPVLQPFSPAPEGAQALSKTARAWIDREKQHVIVDARVSLRAGILEMFACTPNTKEHESIVSVDSQAFVLHAGLLAVGAEPGTPVEFAPEYKPPTGTEIEIEVQWNDAEGKPHKARAQDWIRDARTGKAMDLPWVFAGSSFWHDEETGRSGYQAEAGDLVCVANFSTAMLDVPAELTNDNASLLYEAFTERVPPLGWPVRLVFKPVLDDAKSDAASNADAAAHAKPAPASGSTTNE